MFSISCQDFLKRGGNRYATFLLYLNDDFEDGETYFPLRNKKIKPEKGKRFGCQT